MNKSTLARTHLDGTGWAHPYGHGPFDPYLYADGGDGGASASTSPTPGGEPVAVPETGGQPAAPAGAVTSGQDIASLPDWAQKVITEARAEAGKARTVAKQNAATEARQQLAQELAPILGLGGDKPPTPEELTAQLRESQGQITSAQEQAAAAAIELHVYKTAARLGADADALLDSRAFCDSIDALDPDQQPEQFNAAVQQAIEAALHRNPSLRARSAGRSGGDMGGGGSGDQPHSLDKQIAEATAKRDFATVIRLKRQRAATT
ncbi:hypothetical protein [Streptomyces sp.]|uniref:hypothetical protein n=1 Tax=Streptomyces sp. TaxID=1931 RepID=UPI002D77AC07|nr:hypothetical protein [Streptomyces sp.]HET6356089.1 hypothetical protein [Streptomyces sp.]